MPEGDSVFRQCRVLDDALAGGVITAAELRVPRLAERDLRGRRVAEVAPRGKHVLIRLEPGLDREALTLHSHLMMEGRWQIDVVAAGSPWPAWRSPAHQARILLEAERPDGTRVRATGFEVQQVRLVPTAHEADLVGHLGPDLLDPAWSDASRDEAVRRLVADPARPIGAALLDQRCLAGIGNIYRSEVCFLRRIHPSISVGRVARDADLGEMVDLARRLLVVNRDRARRVTTGGMLGRHGDLWVYGRAGRPCRRCGARIRREELGDPLAPAQQERSIYVCPSCQGSGDRRARAR